MARKGRQAGSATGRPGRPTPRRPATAAPHTTRSSLPARPGGGSPPWALRRVGDPSRRGWPGVDGGSGCGPPPSRPSGGSHRRPSSRHPARPRSHDGPGGVDPVGPSVPPDAGVGSRRGVGVGRSSRQAGPALLPPGGDDGPTRTGLHPLAEPVLAGSLPGVRLVRTLHRRTPLDHPGVIRRGSARVAVDFVGSRRPVRSWRSSSATVVCNGGVDVAVDPGLPPSSPSMGVDGWKPGPQATATTGDAPTVGRDRLNRPPDLRSSTSRLSTVSTGSPPVPGTIHPVSTPIPTTWSPHARSARKRG